MRLINLDDILKQFPKADFDGDNLENMKAYPHWKTDITGLFTILKSVPIIEACEDAISREKAIKQCGFGMTSLLIADCLKRLPSVTPSYNSIKTELEQTKAKGEWKNIYAESEGSNSWIEFTCPHCGNTFGIESGQYGWSYGDTIPWKACPMCGGLAEHEPYKAESEDAEC